MTTSDQTPFDRRLKRRNVALDLDLTTSTGSQDDPIIVLRFGDYTLLLHPFQLTNQVCVDVNGYVDGVKGRVATYGIEHNPDGQPQAFEPQTGGQQQLTEAWGTSNGRPATPFVCVVLGEQGGPAPDDVHDNG